MALERTGVLKHQGKDALINTVYKKSSSQVIMNILCIPHFPCKKSGVFVFGLVLYGIVSYHRSYRGFTLRLTANILGRFSPSLLHSSACYSVKYEALIQEVRALIQEQSFLSIAIQFSSSTGPH